MRLPCQSLIIMDYNITKNYFDLLLVQQLNAVQEIRSEIYTDTTKSLIYKIVFLATAIASMLHISTRGDSTKKNTKDFVGRKIAFWILLFCSCFDLILMYSQAQISYAQLQRCNAADKYFIGTHDRNVRNIRIAE